MTKFGSFAVALVLACLIAPALRGADSPPAAVVTVSDAAALNDALRGAKPGTHIRVAAGNYARVSAENLAGTAERPIVVEAADPKDPPMFVGPRLGLHVSRCAHLVLRNLAVRDTENGGINIDDGGDREKPSHHVVLEGITVTGVSAGGNHDAFKLSGVTDFVIRGCTADGWGGSGVDMVGCHRGVVERCTFRGNDGHASNGVQVKGGSSGVAVRRCTFVRPGGRSVNVGGSTGLAYFRPPDAKHEAKDIVVEGCRFIGGDAPVSFVGVDGAVVRYNTIYAPRRWVVRILQENRDARFIPCRNGKFENNVVVFDAATVRSPVNVGEGTTPDSFTFAGNVWYAKDDPTRSRPKLPVPERDGVYGIDPKLKAPADEDLTTSRIGSTARAGAEALPGGGNDQ